MKHAVISGALLGLVYSIHQSSTTYAQDPLMSVLNAIAGIFVAGPLFGLFVLSPPLSWFYQWRTIRSRERRGIPHPTPHSYRGDKWLEPDEEDPVRADVDKRELQNRKSWTH